MVEGDVEDLLRTAASAAQDPTEEKTCPSAPALPLPFSRFMNENPIAQKLQPYTFQSPNPKAQVEEEPEGLPSPFLLHLFNTITHPTTLAEITDRFLAKSPNF